MIDKTTVETLVNEAISNKPELFSGSVLVKRGNIIFVFLDSDQAVLIEDCATVSKYVESHLNREKEDFELTVSSFGADQPLQKIRQYRKHLGKEVTVKTITKEIYKGKMIELDTDGITLELKPLKKKEIVKPLKLDFAIIAETRLILNFNQHKIE